MNPTRRPKRPEPQAKRSMAIPSASPDRTSLSAGTSNVTRWPRAAKNPAQRRRWTPLASPRKAIESGDVKGLKDILRREYLKRTPGAETGMTEEAAQPQPQASGMPAIDKELIDAMIQIAKDNSVTMDWMILRAIKVYIDEYRKTGKL